MSAKASLSAAMTSEKLDFAPRFALYDRTYKPAMIVRILRPLSGTPRVRVSCRPVYDYGRITGTRAVDRPPPLPDSAG